MGTIFQNNTRTYALPQRRITRFRAPSLNSFSTISKPRPAKILPHKFAQAAATVTIGIGFLIGFSEDLKHGYAAAERSGRVLLTLALCINE